MHEHEVSGRPAQARRAGERRQSPRRRASGPRPVRPEVGAVAVRPAEPERPRLRSGVASRRPQLRVPAVRLLVRRPRTAVPAAGGHGRLRRFLAGVALAAVAAAVVIGLGFLGGEAAHMREGERGEQIVTEGSLTSVSSGPGQMLRVTSG